MAQAKQGDLVKVHYTGTLEDGSTFDSSADRDPLQFVIGEGMLIPAFEQAIVGMLPGDSRSVHIPADDAYGPYMDELILEVDKNQIPESLNPEEGMQLQITQDDGSSTVVKVVKLTDEKVYLDANHPLAGKDLNFNIELVDIAGH
ncbi:FKBP-type peptidyl-prolyl cis-trans isomerase SlyD [uncultured bacterium]|nr:FKBP-type peptidyl-prolyl cis-trans isomerase SlyD [uncultured bacterium]